MRRLPLSILAVMLLLVPVGAPAAAQPDGPVSGFEVWALDQSDTHPDGGGLLYIWDGEDLSRNARRAVPEVLDLAELATAAGCPVARRPHMVLHNRADPPTHVVVANVGSGDVHVIDVATRRVVGCVRTATSGSLAAHAATPSPDSSLVLVADIGAPNQSGFLHKITTDYATNTYALTETLPLADLTEELGTLLARPICLEFTADGRFAYVTMAGGGVVAVAVGSADDAMTVAHVYPAETVPGTGCGAFRLPGDRMLTNSESIAPDAPPDALNVFDTSGIEEGVFPDPVRIELPGKDTHGVAVCEDPAGDLYAWTVMRLSNHVNVVDLQTNEVVTSRSFARPWSPNPTGDLISLRGNKLFVSLRGPVPLTAIGGFQDGARAPGVAVLTIDRTCRAFGWGAAHLASMADPTRTTTLSDGTVVTAADPHGLEVVERAD